MLRWSSQLSIELKNERMVLIYLAMLSSKTSIPLEVNSASCVGSRTTSVLVVVVTTDPVSLEVSSILSLMMELTEVFLVSTVSSIRSPEGSSTRILERFKGYFS